VDVGFEDYIRTQKKTPAGVNQRGLWFQLLSEPQMLQDLPDDLLFLYESDDPHVSVCSDLS
jgi:hypothetical protein